MWSTAFAADRLPGVKGATIFNYYSWFYNHEKGSQAQYLGAEFLWISALTRLRHCVILALFSEMAFKKSLRALWVQNFSNYYQLQALQRIQEKIKGNAFSRTCGLAVFSCIASSKSKFPDKPSWSREWHVLQTVKCHFAKSIQSIFFTALCRMSLFKLVIVVFCMLNVTTYNNNLWKCLILFKCL